MNDTPLSFALFTDPEPLQAGPPQVDAPPTKLTIVVSNDAHELVQCQSISFDFLEGTNAKDFFADAEGVGTSAPTGWSIKASGPLFTATPDTPANGKIGGEGLTFEFSNIKVNQQVGTSNLTVTSETSAGAINTVLPLAKFPQQFELGPLQVTPPPPVDPGSSVVLSWSGSDGATYELQYEDSDGNTVTISHVEGDPNSPLPATGTYTINNLERTTTFYLLVTLAVPDQDEPTTSERSISVDVIDRPPTITFFQGKVETSLTSVTLVLNWEAQHADTCSISGDFNSLNTSSTDDSFKIDLGPSDAIDKTYTLTANRADFPSATAHVSITCTPELTNQGGLEGQTRLGDLAVSPDGAYLYVTDWLKNAYVVDAHTLRVLQTASLRLSSIAVSPGGTKLFATSSEGIFLEVLNSANLQPTGLGTRLGVSDKTSMMASPDGTRLYVADPSSEQLWVLNPDTLDTLRNPVLLGFSPGSIAISPDHTKIYLTVLRFQLLIVLDPNSLQPIATHNTPGFYPLRVAASADGLRIYIADNQQVLHTLDANTFASLRNPVTIHGSEWAGLAVSPDNSHIYTLDAAARLSMFSTFSTVEWQ